MRTPTPKSESKAAPRRRASTALVLLTLAVLTVPGVLANVKPDAPTLLERAVPDPTGLRETYRDYELQVMDPYLWREQLKTGAVDVTLRGRSYHVLVEPVPWDTTYTYEERLPDGRVVLREPLFQPVAYVGRVAGDDAASAHFVVMGSGVYGNVRSVTEDVWVEPVLFTQPAAPPGVSVVYRSTDAVQPEFPGHVLHATEDVAAPIPAGDGPLVAVGSPGPDRTISLWVDPLLDNTAGRDEAIATFNSLNVDWFRAIGFRFTRIETTVRACTACTSNNDNEILAQFTTTVNVGGQPWSNYHVANLLTGKSFASGFWGLSDQPGRHSWIRGGSGTTAHDRLIAIMHEVGHNFGAWHSRGVVYRHEHGGGQYGMHETIMTNGGTESWPEFSTSNANWIRSCNSHGWQNGNKAPGSPWTYGVYCHRGLETARNGGEGPFYSSMDSRGKLLRNVPPGDVSVICAYVQSGGTSAVLGVNKAPLYGPPLFTVTINAGVPGWACGGGPNEYFWPHDTMFVYKISGTAAIGYDTNAPYDGHYSFDNGWTWPSENVRRGYYVELLSSRMQPNNCGVLASGATLARGSSIASCSGQYTLVHQNDGNVVLYNTTGGVTKVDWASHTPNQATTSLVMQSDGNLVLYDGPTPRWSSATAGNPGAWLEVRNDGVLSILGRYGQSIWYEGCGLLGPNSRILRGGELRSCDRRYALVHQLDGNAVIQLNGVYDWWATGTYNLGTTELKMQDDGNLVLYAGGTAIWASDTNGHPHTWLRLSDTGRLAIWTPYGAPICNKLRC